jgi:sugar diacid utilization regulator
MTRFLSSLPKIYKLLIMAWNLLPKEQQSLELLKLRLLEKEERLIDQIATEDETKAFTAWSANCS